MGVLLYAVLIITGVVLAYGGYRLYTVALFVLGAILTAGGYHALSAAGRSGPPGLIETVSVGLVGGFAFLFVQLLAILAGGFAIGWIAVTMLGVPDEALQAFGGLVGAGLSLLLYTVVIILSTAGVGAFVVAKAIAAGPSADLSLVLATKESTLTFWSVSITGALVQFGILASESEGDTHSR